MPCVDQGSNVGPAKRRTRGERVDGLANGNAAIGCAVGKGNERVAGRDARAEFPLKQPSEDPISCASGKRPPAAATVWIFDKRKGGIVQKCM